MRCAAWLAALALSAGCTGEALLGEAASDTAQGPVGGRPAPEQGYGGAAGLGGSAGASSPVVPSASPDAAIDVPVPEDAGLEAEPGALADRKPRPLDDGEVSGPITGGNGQPVVFELNAVDLAAHGYVEEELYLEGVATAYAAKGELGLDGVWETTPNGRAAYKTRLLVRRPADADRFNGTVLVEWLNTTSGADATVGFAFGWEELLRGGYGYVGVSAQQAGVGALAGTDPVRYAALAHPSDAYAYDIFAQAGAAIGWPGAIDVMHGLRVERLIAYGVSQSAMRMITYVNAVHPRSPVYDGFIIHSRAGWGAPVGVESDVLFGDGRPVHVRSDLDEPVMQLFTESEVVFSLGPAFQARQPDTDRLRSWEVAGAAHADQYLLGQGTDLGCGLVNDGPQHFVVKAAMRAMHRWLKDGIAPPAGEPLVVDAAQHAIVRDALGNALGGIRTPAIEAPTAMLSGEAAPENAWNPLCAIFGLTKPFTPEQLRALYPTHEDYVDGVTRAARASREAGFILPEAEAAIVAEAILAPIPP